MRVRQGASGTGRGEGWGVNVVPNKQWELYFGLRFSLLGLFDLFNLAGLVHHFPVDHGLSDHLDDLPGANIRLFCREEQQKLVQNVSVRFFFWFFLYTWTCKVCVAKDVLLCFARLLCLRRLICH